MVLSAPLVAAAPMPLPCCCRRAPCCRRSTALVLFVWTLNARRACCPPSAATRRRCSCCQVGAQGRAAVCLRWVHRGVRLCAAPGAARATRRTRRSGTESDRADVWCAACMRCTDVAPTLLAAPLPCASAGLGSTLISWGVPLLRALATSHEVCAAVPLTPLSLPLLLYCRCRCCCCSMVLSMLRLLCTTAIYFARSSSWNTEGQA